MNAKKEIVLTHKLLASILNEIFSYRDTVYIEDMNLVGIINAVDPEQTLCVIQLCEFEEPTKLLKHPRLWRPADWASNYEVWKQQKKASAEERERRLTHCENIERIAMKFSQMFGTKDNWKQWQDMAAKVYNGGKIDYEMAKGLGINLEEVK